MSNNDANVTLYCDNFKNSEGHDLISRYYVLEIEEDYRDKKYFQHLETMCCCLSKVRVYVYVYLRTIIMKIDCAR